MKKIISSVLLGMSLIGCTAIDGDFNSKTTGTAGGAATGALIGQLIGKDTKGTLIGAGIGALAGLSWGAYRDYQEKELKERLKDTDVQINRDGEDLNLYLPGGVTFATSSADIAPSFYGPLNSIASVLIGYPESRIVVNGYTDNTGSPEFNLDLSERRASSVGHYLVAQGVSVNRISTVGHGISNPKASNATPEGRAINRRVEIKILPLN